MAEVELRRMIGVGEPRRMIGVGSWSHSHFEGSYCAKDGCHPDPRYDLNNLVTRAWVGISSQQPMMGGLMMRYLQDAAMACVCVDDEGVGCVLDCPWCPRVALFLRDAFHKLRRYGHANQGVGRASRPAIQPHQERVAGEGTIAEDSG